MTEGQDPEAQPEPQTPTDNAGGEKGSILARINPAKLFRRNSAEGLLREAEALLERNHYAQATIVFRAALEQDPESVRAYRGLGKVVMKKGGRSNLLAALEYLAEAVRRDPMDEEAYNLTALVYGALGRTREATREKKKVTSLRTVRRDASNAVAQNNVGILLAQAGRTEEAIGHFHKAIAADPNYDVPHRSLASIYYKLAEMEPTPAQQKELLGRAHKSAQQALSMAEHPMTLVTYARILMKAGEFKHALKMMSRADELHPGNKLIITLKQSLLEKLNRLGEARSYSEDAKQVLAAESGAA